MSRIDIKRHNDILKLMIGLSLILGGLTTNLSYGVPACPKVQQLTQPDGSIIQAKLWGDEWLNGWETPEGYTIAKNVKGYWTFAKLSSESNRIEATETIASNTIIPEGLKAHLRPERPAATERIASFPSKGYNSIPVLLINYSDTKTVYTSQDFFSLLFAGHPAIATGPGSMRDFYIDASYSALFLSSGASGVSGWHTSAGKHGEFADSEGTKSPAELVKEAILAADKEGFDFSQYDNNNDGYVDVIMVVHQGGGAEAGDPTSIWSHSWSLSSAGVGAVIVDGVTADNYIIQPETLFGDISTIGVFCHEFGHAMGLPDLYDYGYDSEGAGNFCLMAGGSWGGNYGDSPIYPNAFSKMMLGWIEPTVIREKGSYSLPAVENSSSVYKLSGEEFPDSEYYLIENRQGIKFDAALPGEYKGMLIWHVDESRWNNDDQTHYLCDLEEAGGVQHLEQNSNSGNDQDYFRSGNVTEFNDSTTPNSHSYTGKLLKMGLRQISASSPNMSFTIDVSAYRLKSCCIPADSGTIITNPIKDVFEEKENVQILAVAADGWEFVRWEGDIGDITATANPITLSMTDTKTVHAVFQLCYRITVLPTGQGQVQKSINETKVAPNTRITLTAVPAEGWVFRKWWGDVDSTVNPISFTVDSNKLIQAEFINPSQENYSLTLNVIGSGQVFPFGGSFAKDAAVTLTATPAEGWKFVQWRGDVVSKDNPIEITMDQAKCISGVFIEQNAAMPADETIQSDQSKSGTFPVTAETTPTDTTEKAGDFGFSNLITSCTLLSMVLMGLMLGGFSLIRIKR